MTRDEAVALIERMKTIRPTCEKCETMPFVASLRDPDYCPEGYEVMSHCAGYVKRCDACATGHQFPWADDLTPEAVCAFVAKEPWRDDTAWLLDELKPVADDCKPRGGFEFL